MSNSASLDFQQILLHPTLAYEEGLSFFKGVGLMNDTLRQLANDLDDLEISYNLIGAIALNQFGYHRFTVDIDILMTTEGLLKFHDKLVGRGYRPEFDGNTRKFRATKENIPIEVFTAGEYPGDGKPKSVMFPDPAEYWLEIDGIKTITIEKLVELKIASGLTGAGRRKDLADVQELIWVRELDAAFANQIGEYVRSIYL